MPRDNMIVGLDIGTTKVVVVVAEVNSEGRLDIVGLGETSSGGLRKGIIIDIENTARAIEKAVEQAERMSGLKINSAFVGLTGPHIQSINNKGVVAVAGEEGEITPEDVQRVLQAARVIPLTAERRVIHVLPRQYIVDGYDGITDPVGMSGSRLEVETQIVTAAGAVVQITLKSVQRANLTVDELVLNPLASAEAVLQQAEKELGAVVIDIGGGTTEIAIIYQGSLWFAAVLPVGSEHITGDLAVGLRTPILQAEGIKKEHGCVFAGLIDNDEQFIEVPPVGGKEKRRVSLKTLATIIEPRVEEIFTLALQKINAADPQTLLPGGVILTGGGALLKGMTQLSSEVLGMPVRLGVPEGNGGLADMVANPAYATAVGLLRYGANRLAYSQAAAGQEAIWAGFWQRLKNWWRELF
ncbi:MAG: cell division protein FtsA [Clostridia bacterium]|nr:cell division protein FtsA [Clostridia bacterium]